MKKINFLFVAILLSFTSCEIFEKEDFCDGTVLTPSKTIVIKGIVTATDGDFGDGKNIIPIKVRFYKVVCDGDGPKPGSTFTYSGNLERPNFLTYESGSPTYELRNSKDKIAVELLSDYDLDGVWDYIKYQEYYDAAHLSNSKTNVINIEY